MHNATPQEDTPHGSEIAIMEKMHWSWAELQATPVPVVAEIAYRIEAESHWRKKRRDLDEAMKK